MSSQCGFRWGMEHGCTRKRRALPAVRFQRRDQKSVMLLLRYGWSKWGAMRSPTMLVARLAGPSMSRLKNAYIPRTAQQLTLRQEQATPLSTRSFNRPDRMCLATCKAHFMPDNTRHRELQ